MGSEMTKKRPEPDTGKKGIQKKRQVPNHTGIPDRLKEGAEAVSGFSFDDVRIHYSSNKPKELFAHAYTQGSHVYIAPGQESSLSHELGHVIQQKQGRVRPTFYLGRAAINDDQRLEREADRLGSFAMRQTAEPIAEKRKKEIQSIGPAIQMSPNAEFGTAKSLWQYLGEQQEQQEQQKQQRQSGRRKRHGQQPAASPSAAPKSAEETVSPDYPLMVYETFGADVAQLVNVYRQSCQYPGKTVCILGFNQRYRISAYASGRLPDANVLLGVLAGEQCPGHDVYVIPFKWKSVGGSAIKRTEDEAANGKSGKAADEAAFNAADEKLVYTLPYYEVRGRLMEEATDIVENIREDHPDTKVLFRWIDRDADADTSGDIDAATLSNMAQNGDLQFLSGTYDWRTDADCPIPSAFMDAFNKAERELRVFWYDLNKDLHVGSFYLPEPVLIMNETAHRDANRRLNDKVAETPRTQDKESMAAFSGKLEHVRFLPSFSVSKPNKRLTYGDRTSYLHILEGMFTGPKISSLPTFYQMLSGVRQSAFDNGQWAFLQEAAYNEWYNEAWKDDLEALYNEACRTKRQNPLPELMIRSQLLLNKKRKELANQLFAEYNKF